MTAFESYKKFGVGIRSFAGGVLMSAGGLFSAIGLAFFIADRLNADFFGMEGIIMLFFVLLFVVMGLGMVIFGWRMFSKDKKKLDGLKEAYENNRCIMADIVDVRIETSTQKTSDNMFTGVKYREYYMVECRYKEPATGKTHIYYSPALYFDPTELIIAKQVPVYIDRNDETNFFVDIYQALAPLEIHE